MVPFGYNEFVIQEARVGAKGLHPLQAIGLRAGVARGNAHQVGVGHRRVEDQSRRRRKGGSLRMAPHGAASLENALLDAPKGAEACRGQGRCNARASVVSRTSDEDEECGGSGRG